MSSIDQPSSTRAEQVRIRRKQNSQQRVAQAAHKARQPVATPPVTVRGSYTGTPLRQRAQTSNPRRQYYYSVGVSGAELRLPALPVFHFGWRLVSFALVLILGAAYIMVSTSSTFQVHSVEVSGIQRVQAADIDAELDLRGQPIYTVQPKAVAEKLSKAFPELTDIKVTVGLPAQVTVSAVERQPVLAWQFSKKTIWVDASGAIFQARGDAGPLLTIHSEDNPPLVAVESEPATETAKDNPKETSEPSLVDQRMNSHVLAAVQKLNTLVPPETPLYYSAQNGLGWQDPGGWQVYVGLDFSNLELKMTEYQLIIDHLKQQELTPTMVSVENPRAPFYRLEQ